MADFAADQAKELLDDAILIASFGQRAGRLDDDTLFLAIQKVKQGNQISWGSQEFSDLQAAINKSIKLISPATLIDLKSGWNPFGKQREKSVARESRSRVLFVFATVLLIFVCGFYTVWYKRAAALVEDSPTIKIDRQDEIINDVFFRAIESGEIDKDQRAIKISSLSDITISEKVDELRRLQRQLGEFKQNYNDIIVDNVPGKVLIYSALNVLWPPKLISTAQAGSIDIYSLPQQPVSQLTDRTKCILISQTPQPAGAEASPTTHSISNLSGYVLDRDDMWNQIRCIVGLRSMEELGLANVNQEVVALKNKIDVLGLWFLPALYGALGAVMFYMREFLNPMTRNPGLASVFLRVSLGVFAGIAVVWFLSPAVKQGIGIPDLGFGILTVAFLLGFSVDVFFTLLDKLVTMAKNGIGRLGAPTPAPGVPK
ncbi:hypothetical protein C3941_03775 [Kaistia algarum]|uniref:hypothetical protein n=1 Tax=Kaistia algarum TaxID=2083279 RepID=UPI000CE71FCD|nr:hypothetical protein [Kaistia algarum]MCX5512668.1 hypothetical protein [Kaistia algarum]PPE81821.1 hypothetical protein C3941_03775 [Kaistia algarum]